MKTMQEHIGELSVFFDFYNYVNQFSNEGIAFTFYKEAEAKQPFEVGISFDNKVKWITGKPESNTGLNRSMAERFYHRLLQNSPHYKESFVEKHFIEENLEYLKSIPAEIKKEFRYIFYPLFELFDKAKENGGLQKVSKTNSQPTYLQLAFYYYFMQVAEKIKWFDSWNEGREAAYKEVCKIHGKTAKTAWKLFQTEYRLIEGTNSKDRWQHCKKSDYPIIIEMLKGCPEALDKAKEQLKETNT